MWKTWKTGISRRPSVGTSPGAAFATVPLVGLEDVLDMPSLDRLPPEWLSLDRLPLDRLSLDGFPPVDPLLQALAILGLGFGLAFLFFARPARRKLKRLEARVNETEAEAEELRNLLSTTSGALFFWRHESEEETAFGDFSSLLPLSAGATPSFADALAELDAASAKRLRAGVATLRDAGGDFAFEVTAVGGRALKVRGREVMDADGTMLGALVRFDDVTEAEARAKKVVGRNAKLLEDRNQLRFLLDQLPFPVWQRSKDLALTFCNWAYASVVGMRPEEAIERKQEFAEGVIADQGLAVAKRAWRAGSAQSESHYFVIEGLRRLLEVTEIPIVDGEGMVGYSLDFTEVERVQDELSRHIDAQSKVLEGLATAIAIYGPDTRLKFFNQAFASLWRLSEDWLAMEPMQGEVLEALRSRRRLPETVDFPAYKGEQLARFTSLIDPVEELLHLPDGTTLRSTVSPHPFGGLLCTYEDVTDKLALERSYNTLIKVQQQSLDNLYEGVAVFGSDGRLKLSNPAYARIWGFSPIELEGEPHVSELVETSERFAITKDWQALRAKIVAGTCERVPKHGRFDRQDGTTVDYASLPLPDGGVLWRYVDVTDSTRVERALRERNEALEAADKLMSEFVAHVSYELRTPLNTIIGFSQLLEQGYFGSLTTQQAGYVEGILDSSQVLLSLINDILDLAVIEVGQMAIQQEEVPIRTLMEEVLRLVREKANEKNLIVVMDFQGNPPAIRADKQRLKQVLFKLLNNAINFSTSGGTISLSARKENEDLVLEVMDTGVGIPLEEQERIFERFERGSSSKGRGSGLGLPLVKKFVELHGGRVELTSAPGKGTTVRCCLPYHATDLSRDGEEAPPSPAEALPGGPSMKTGT